MNRSEGAVVLIGQLDLNINFHESRALQGQELGPIFRQLSAKFAVKGSALPSLLRELAEQLDDYMAKLAVETPKVES